MTRRILVATVAVLLWSTTGWAASTVKIASFNAKSDPETDINKIAQQVEELTASEGIDVWVMQEVDGWEAAVALRDAAAEGGPASARWVYSVSRFVVDGPGGRPDLLAVIFRADMLRQVETSSLNDIQITDTGSWNFRMRPMFALRLEHRPSGQQFWIGTVHLKCCGDGVLRRKLQAQRLVEWVGAQARPVILMGDFNMPIPPDNAAGLPSSEAFETLSSAMTWLRPGNPTATQVQGSMLDAVFFTALLSAWQPAAEILNADKDLAGLESQGFSDHRPLLTSWTLP